MLLSSKQLFDTCILKPSVLTENKIEAYLQLVCMMTLETVCYIQILLSSFKLNYY